MKILILKKKKGLDCIATNVAKTIKKMEEKYQRLNIKQKPYIYLKANRGTYGMGIMLLEKPDDIYQINKKDRNKMNMIKQNTQNNEILIQEGIETWGGPFFKRFQTLPHLKTSETVQKVINIANSILILLYSFIYI